ncbi:hypothetical protein [Rhodopirellula sp. P2]|uniref:hypothetical protein n=1 Tax=Rhodopirellula sp. P2 TaxID=2127060 RepID=UPI0023683E03|nr:hypothetical protein [Rhodopirellula sp. P2]WDQ18899.1 hypothetical protein PSR62_10225 [Rhodopirellula sp. P2]
MTSLLGHAQAQEVPFPNEKLETLFAGMRTIDESRGAHAFAATIKLVEDHRGSVTDLSYLYLRAVNEKGQKIVGYATVQRLPFWKVKLSSNGEDHFLYGSRYRLAPAAKDEDKKDPFPIPSFDPISHSMRPISAIRGPVSTAKGWHYRRSAKYLENFKDGKHFELIYKDPGTGLVKDKITLFRFDRRPTPHVVQWDLRCVLKNGAEFDGASTVTEWGEVAEDHYLPKTIHGATSLPGNGPKYVGAIEIQWDFDVPHFDVDASDWVDVLAKSFSVDPFLEIEDE